MLTITQIETIANEVTHPAEVYKCARDARNALADIMATHNVQPDNACPATVLLFNLVYTLKAMPWNGKSFGPDVLLCCTELKELAARMQEAEKATAEPKQAEALPKTLKGLTGELARTLADIQHKSIRAGLLLLSAKEFHPDSKAWLAWAADNFQLGKAQVYKLVKVAEAFGHDERFANVSMRVLYALASQATPAQIEEAAVTASKGQLNTVACSELLSLNKPEASSTQTLASAPDSAEEMPIAAPDSGVQAAPVAPADTGAPVQAMPAVAAPELSELTSELKALRAELNQLRIENANLKAEGDRKSKLQPAAPMLPHFQSTNMAIRLGLDVVTNDAVNKAYRELARIYWSNTQVLGLLVDARDALLAK